MVGQATRERRTMAMKKEVGHIILIFKWIINVNGILKPQWSPLLQLIIRYITCDCRFSCVHFYHLRLLMAFKGSRVNLPCFLFNSLEKMACTVQKTVGNQDRSLLHHGLLKSMIQYPLSTMGKNWDQFLNENNFGQTQSWPSPLPKIRQKRRWPYVHEPSKLDSELNKKRCRCQ